MKDSDVIVLDEPKLSIADQFYLPQVLVGLGTTMKHMFRVLGGKDMVVQYPEERREDLPVDQGGMLTRTYRGVHAHRGGNVALGWAREIPRQGRHRRAALHLLRHVRGSLPSGRH